MAEIIFKVRHQDDFEEIKDITVAMQAEDMDIPAGIRVFGGNTNDDDVLHIQAWHFDTERWDQNKAEKWLNKNYHYYIDVIEVPSRATNNRIVSNVILKREGKWFVYSEDRKKKLGGPFNTEAKAKKRLRQIEFFKHQTNSFQTLAVNLKGKVRHDTMEGRDYLVAPMVMLTVGVVSGSNGPLFYPEEELSKTPAVWNYKPIVVYHPQINGVGVSACDPDILTSRKVGVIMKAKYENGKLKAEAWLEENRLREVDDRILEALNTGTAMELSTGVFTDNEIEEGEWKGKSYYAIARNYRPDHLALLPDQIGACSIADGAGLLKLNKKASEGAGALAVAARAFLEAYEENQKLLEDERATNEPKKGEDDGVGKHVGGVMEMNDKKGDSGMDKEKFVNDLIKNSEAWEDGDREFLMGLEEKQLEKLVPPVVNEEEMKKQVKAKAEELLAKNKKEEEAVEAKKKADEEAAKLATNQEKKKEPIPTVEEYVANAPEGIRDMLSSGLKAHEEEKAKYIKLITANEANLFTEDQLKEKGLTELQALASLAATPEERKKVSLYGGQGDPPEVTANKEEPLLAPVMNFSEEKGGK